MSAELALQAMAAMQQQIAVMQARKDDQIHVCSARHQGKRSPGHRCWATTLAWADHKLSAETKAQFQRWSQEAESFFSGVFPDGARLLARAAERTDEISSNKINDEFVVGDHANRVFADGEAHEIVIHSR